MINIHITKVKGRHYIGYVNAGEMSSEQLKTLGIPENVGEVRVEGEFDVAFEDGEGFVCSDSSWLVFNDKTLDLDPETYNYQHLADELQDFVGEDWYQDHLERMADAYMDQINDK